MQDECLLGNKWNIDYIVYQANFSAQENDNNDKTSKP